MGNICCQADVASSTIQADMPKSKEYQPSTLPQDDHVLEEWLSQNNIKMPQTSPAGNQQNQQNGNPVNVMKHENKNRYYVGAWKDGVADGNALIYQPNRMIFSGSFHNGLPEGPAVIKFIQENADFQGNLTQGKANGVGQVNNLTYKYRFNGEWENSRPKKGTLTFSHDPNMSSVQLIDVATGQAIILYKDGRRYEGTINVAKLIPHGQGTVTFPHTSRTQSYTGHWVNGRQNGKGKSIFYDGSEYEGDYKDTLKHGEGRFVYPNGNVYEGFWRNGKQFGPGIFIRGTDKQIVKRGRWRDGAFETQLSHEEYKHLYDTFPQELAQLDQQNTYENGQQNHQQNNHDHQHSHDHFHEDQGHSNRLQQFQKDTDIKSKANVQSHLL